MKLYIPLIFSILVEAIPGFSQYLACSDSTSIRKNKVKTSSSWFFNETFNNDLGEIWTYDKQGRMTSYELVDSKDTSKDIEIYFYKNNLLIEEWHIGTWHKYDTIRTIYEYNKSNQPLSKTVKGGWCSYSFECVYDDKGLLTNRVYEEGSNCSYDDDTLIYDTQKQLRKKLNISKDFCFSYTYDLNGCVLSEKKTAISDTNIIYQFINYYYLEGKLVKEEIENSKSGKKERLRKYQFNYYYYDNGLLKEIRRIDNGQMSYYNKLTYTFY